MGKVTAVKQPNQSADRETPQVNTQDNLAMVVQPGGYPPRTFALTRPHYEAEAYRYSRDATYAVPFLRPAFAPP